MKKLVFTIQVFGLIVLFPIYVMVELNHGAGSLPVGKSPSTIIKKTAKKNIPELVSLDEDNGRVINIPNIARY